MTDLVNAAIQRRQEKQRTEILEILHDTPIVHFACKKVGIARSTFYRWIHDDKAFESLVIAAMDEGIQRINDMGEAKLIALISEGKMPAIALWLKHNHPRYKPDQKERWARKSPQIEETEQREAERYVDGSDPHTDKAIRNVVVRFEEELKQTIIAGIRKKHETAV